MEFAQFMAMRAQILAQPDAPLDAAETRVTQALRELIPPAGQLNLPPKAHRCHLAEFWLAHYQLPAGYKTRALICKGVRHSLSLLFKAWALEDKTVLLPGDVYPVYGQLAQAAGLRHHHYPLFPQAGWQSASHAEADVILITNPAKPRASALSSNEVSALASWLAQNPQRRVVIDAVYNFQAPLDAATLALLAGGQTMVLHSLSKSWLHPLVMGVALIPRQDIERYTALFRAESPGQAQLQLAHALLNDAAQFPATLVQELAQRRHNLQAALLARGCSLNLPASVPAYLFAAETGFEEMLNQHRILALPLSVFGSRLQNHCVLSSLAMRG